MKKGFVSMSVIYSFLLIFLLVLLSILGIYMQKSRLVDGVVSDAKNNLKNGIQQVRPVIENCAFISKDFEYKNGSETFYIPCSGMYQIEAWGAQGGNFSLTDTLGKGGYTSGKIYLEKNDILNIYVGGSSTSRTGGFNGGGDGGSMVSDGPEKGGGGATDIRYEGTSLNDRIMVAGGGGGSIYYTSIYVSGGIGGGLIGGTASLQGVDHTLATGGTQILGGEAGGDLSCDFGTQGIFGFGGNTSLRYGGGGGGGYYGGGTGGCINAGVSSGAGGSSFISGYAGVIAIDEGTATDPRSHTNNNTKHYSGKYFVDGEMIPGNKSMPSPIGGTEMGHSGNGYARIKYLGDNAPTRINEKLNNVRYIKDCSTGNKKDGYVRWDEIQAIDTNGVNVALGKSIIDNTVGSYPGCPYSRITDGHAAKENLHAATSNDAQGVNRCVTIDLSATYDLNEIVVWHLTSELWPQYQPTYNNYTQVSNDNINWTTIRASESVSEDSTGKRTNAFGIDYEYTGEQQTYTIPISGTYKLEVWGAEGGGDATYHGGKGGYSTGYKNLDVGDIMYVNVGGQGNYCTGASCTVSGGYNGGGSCIAYTNANSTCGSGGGATHIATKSGVLSSLSTNLDSILLVAGGGGGGNYCNSSNYAGGGAGGGIIGGAAVNLGAPHFDGNGGLNATGGTQISGSEFGQAITATDALVGGGSGYWGGRSSAINGAGGGSGYIGGVTEGATTSNQRSGNGYARITYVEN